LLGDQGVAGGLVAFLLAVGADCLGHLDVDLGPLDAVAKDGDVSWRGSAPLGRPSGSIFDIGKLERLKVGGTGSFVDAAAARAAALGHVPNAP
jgi:hypothetical protein